MPSHGLSVHGAEFGVRPDPRQVWQYELAALERLRPLSLSSQVLQPSLFTSTSEPARSHIRYPYVSAMAATTDGALLAVLSSDCRFELHQPPDPYCPLPTPPAASANGSSRPPNADSLRLAIYPADTSARGADICWHPRRDMLVLGLSDRAALWTFDVETCSETAPSGEHSLLGGGPRGVTDIEAFPGCGAVAAASDDGPVYFVDSRSRKLAPAFTAPSMNNAVAAAEPLLFVCGGGCIRVYDIRALPSAKINSAPLTTLQLSTAATDSSLDRAACGSVFSFVHPVESGTRLAFHTITGVVGVANMLTGTAELYPEPPPLVPQEAIPESGLYALGAQERHAQAYPWYIARRRGAVVPSSCGRRWRVVAPCVGRPGFRVVPLNLRRADTNLHPGGVAQLRRKRTVAQLCTAQGGAAGKVIDTRHHVSCLSSDDQLQRVVVGSPGNVVDVYQSNSEPMQEIKADMQ
jgi:hypothetical protein